MFCKIWRVEKQQTPHCFAFRVSMHRVLQLTHVVNCWRGTATRPSTTSPPSPLSASSTPGPGVCLVP